MDGRLIHYLDFFAYHIHMTLPIRLTSEERAALRAELVEIEARIRAKIHKIMLTHQKLPFERMAKGRRLKENCLAAISYLDKGNDDQLQQFIQDLERSGITFKSWNGTKS